MSHAPDHSVIEFIDHARSKGMDHATIRMLLLSVGWKEKDIARAMTEHGLDMPVPSPPDIGGAREAFMHLVSFAALYTAVIASVSLAFSFIALMLPDPAITQYGSARIDWVRSAMRWEMAALMVSFPSLIWWSGLLLKEMRSAPDKARSPIRRWLTYLTLFMAAVAVGIDLITLLSSLLEGEHSTRFLLKVLAVLAAAGACFAYYFLSLRMTPDESRQTSLHKRFGWTTSAVAGVMVVVGLVMTGSPGAERVRKFDTRRVEDLRMIYGEVMTISFGRTWRAPTAPLTQAQPLPASLDAIVRQAVQLRPRIADPETGKPYEYRVLGDTRFQMCGVFGQARDEPLDVVWNHPAGRHCFDFDALSPIR
jgi:hypothetical protein